jgi:hypothetical protein
MVPSFRLEHPSDCFWVPPQSYEFELSKHDQADDPEAALLEATMLMIDDNWRRGRELPTLKWFLLSGWSILVIVCGSFLMVCRKPFHQTLWVPPQSYEFELSKHDQADDPEAALLEATRATNTEMVPSFRLEHPSDCLRVIPNGRWNMGIYHHTQPIG